MSAGLDDIKPVAPSYWEIVGIVFDAPNFTRAMVLGIACAAVSVVAKAHGDRLWSCWFFGMAIVVATSPFWIAAQLWFADRRRNP